MEGCAGVREDTSNWDIEQRYMKAAPTGAKVIVQNTQILGPFDELFYTSVNINNVFQIRGMRDSGSMASTLSEQAEKKMVNQLPEPIPLTQEVLLVGCGGLLSRPKCMYEVEMELYGERCIVPVLVVPGQGDDVIIGTNVIRFLMHQLKMTSDYWRLVSRAVSRPHGKLI